jgi:hypothetical protein
MAKKPQLKKHHYYGGAALLVAIGVFFLLGTFPWDAQGKGQPKPPVISNIAISNVGPNSTDISWSTDRVTSDNVCWTSQISEKRNAIKKLSWECGAPTDGSALDKSYHIANLAPGTQYTYFVVASGGSTPHQEVNSDLFDFLTTN